MSFLKPFNGSIGLVSKLALLVIVLLTVSSIWLFKTLEHQKTEIRRLSLIDDSSLSNPSLILEEQPNYGVSVLKAESSSLKPSRLEQLNSIQNLSVKHDVFTTSHLILLKENTLFVMFKSPFYWLFCIGLLGLIARAFYRYLGFLQSRKNQKELNRWAHSVFESGGPEKITNSFEVGEAITLIQDKLAEALSADSDFDQQLRNRTLLDSVTGIGNRQYFNNCLEAFLLEEDAQGAVFIVQLQYADLIMGLYGEDALDKLLKTITDTIEHRVSTVNHAIIARQSEYEFSILLPQLMIKEAAKLAARLLDNLNNLPLPVGTNTEQFFHIGVNCFSTPQGSYQIMAEADMALRTAQLQGPSQWFMFESGEVGQQIAKGSLKWRTLLANVAKHQKFVLFFQPLVSLKKNEIIHHEILAKVRDEDGQLISARIFLPMARKAGVSVEVDKAILLQTANLIKQQLKLSGQSKAGPLGNHCFSNQEIEKNNLDIRSLNLSVESMISVEFHQFFFSMIEQDSQLVDFLSLEISEYQLVSHFNELTSFLAELKLRNIMLVIDKVGQYVVSAKYLDCYPFYGIKLHRSIVSNVHQKNENQLVVRSLKVLCDSKGIEVFAHGVENAKELSALAELGVTAGQGHFFTPPKQDT